jgi:uncharacterized repeat protein (TIGR01451 family)
LNGALVRLTFIATVLLTLVVLQNRGEPAFAGGTITPGGTLITNTATATWQDSQGNVYQEASNEVTVAVQAVSALVVTPKEAAANPALDGYPVGQNVTRNFVITNASNITDAYKISSFTADRGTLVSLAFLTSGGNIPVTIGSTTSPAVAPAQSITVQAVVATAGIAVGNSFALHLTAQSSAPSANGPVTDSGEQWLVTGSGAQFSGPGGANTPISKTVNQQNIVQAQGGAIVTFDVVVKNDGGSAATNTVMTDTIPDGLTADLSTVKINGAAVTNATLSGQLLTVPMGTLGVGETDDVSFNSTVVQADTLGTTFVNVAQISADGVSPISTTPASVLIGTADLVFDPSNNNAPVTGATVALLDANDQLVPLTASSAQSQYRKALTATSAGNTQNPYTTGMDGTYGFALQPSQIPAGGTTFYITVTAPGYLNRRIQMRVTPSAQSALYDVVATSMDGQPLAKAGGYTLTTGSVGLNNIFGLFGNVPLFKTQTLAVDKSVDRTTAEPGDRLVYTINVSDPSVTSLQNVTLIDTLPAGESYAPGTARIDGAEQEPAVSGRTLTWTVPPLAPGTKHQLVYAAVIFPSVPAGTIVTNTVSAQAVISGTLVNVNAAANAQVEIIQGALSDRSVITGRVFTDVMHAGHFVRGDRGLGGVRVYLEDGTSVLTDAQGRFSFPAVRPGMHVLRVDRLTLPDGASGALQHLVHGLLDDGLMQDVEFAIGGVP